MHFNPCDPYDAAALYDMWLNCQGCPATFDFEPSRPLGLDYYHDIGQRAKAERWVVREQDDPSDPLGVSYLVLCACCADRFGVVPEAALRRAPAPAIEEICSALRDAEAGVAA